MRGVIACLVLLGTSLPVASQRARAASSPGALGGVDDLLSGNVLLLIADDLGVDQLAAYGIGSDLPPTPNLDQMAAEGVLFRNAWSQPVCSPTRATIQTGRYAFRTTIGGVINTSSNEPGLSLDEVTLPEMLDLGTGARYAHAMIGKWHLGTSQVGGALAPDLAGYGYFAGTLGGQLGSYTNWQRWVNGVANPTNAYATSVCVDDALDWIHARQGEPWMCVVGFQAPHAPFHAPPANLHTQSLPPVVPPTSCAGNGADPRPFYKAMVQALDTEIGRLLAGLPAGERARTTVLFLGDNGSESCTQAPPSGRAKTTLYEGGVHVPLLASGYRVGQGECAALVNTTDVFATIADLAGVDLSATLPGVVLDSVSFVRCLADPGLELREWLFAETFDQNGPGEPPALTACVPSCQEDIGYDGPGNVVLASCGPPLYGSFGSNNVTWQVVGGPPFANGWLRIGALQPIFVPTFGAWVASSTPASSLAIQLDANGGYATTTWTGNTSSELHYQVVVQDPAQASGYAVSNALRMDLLGTHTRAVRNARHKLIRQDPCTEELYDLVADPFELTDLLQNPLGPEAVHAYLDLSARLETLH